MQIVINIPNKIYDDLMKRREADVADINTVFFAIADGTPLPEGHGRLIDADRLKSMYSINQANFNTVVGIQKWIDYAQTIIEADKEDK